jgi:hypothetical protein
MQSLIEILKINDVKSGVSKSGKPYKLQDAECILRADDGSPQHVGVLNLPRHMVDEAAPKPGLYSGTFTLQASYVDRRIEAVLTGLTPVSPRSLSPVSSKSTLQN